MVFWGLPRLTVLSCSNAVSPQWPWWGLCASRVAVGRPWGQPLGGVWACASQGAFVVALRASPFPVVTSWCWVQKLEPEARSVGQGWCHTAPMAV